MAHHRLCTRQVLGRTRHSYRINHKQLVRGVVTKNLALAASSESVQEPPDSEPHVNVMKDLRSHFSKTGIMTNIGIVDALRRWYPNHTVTQTPKSTGILKFVKAGQAQATLDTNTDYYALRTYKPATDHRKGVGRLKYKVEFGKYNYRWKNRDFHVYVADYWESEYSKVQSHYVLYPRSKEDVKDGQSQMVDKLITAAAQHLSEIDDEIWVYDRGYWRKNHRLWKNVRACDWEDVILSGEMKSQLITDIEGFFDRKEDYKSFGVPWKRGIILHGLPGNGKTISIKALMRSLALRSSPIPTLYVKSLGKSSDQDDIRSIFEKARETAPCLLVFEDIDSLVSDHVRSFFLNEVDGLEGNDGIMMIGSTNYLDRLDAGISKRPSRFDRKYHFPLPAKPERILYCEYWRSKLSKNSSIGLPTQISSAVASITEGFSFAYLQEAFVTALLSIVQTQRANLIQPDAAAMSKSDNLESNEVWHAISKQVQTLRREMKDSRKSVEDAGQNNMLSDARSSSAAGFGLSG